MQKNDFAKTLSVYLHMLPLLDDVSGRVLRIDSDNSYRDIGCYGHVVDLYDHSPNISYGTVEEFA